MKRITFIAAVFTTLFSCTMHSMEDFEKMKEKIKEASANSAPGGGACPVGLWKIGSCGSSKNEAYFEFTTVKNSDGKYKGRFINPDCVGTCTEFIYTFNYTMSGNTCSFTYDVKQPGVTCGSTTSTPPQPNNKVNTMTLECKGSTLTVNGRDVYTKQ